jgi:peroxiredoxin
MKQLTIIVGLFLLFSSVDIFGQSNQFRRFGLDVDQGDVPQGLEIGTTAPDFTAATDHGTTVKLSHMVQNSPVIMFFYRGQWCPVCSRYLKRYADSLSMVQKKGAKVIAVTPETTANIEKTRDQTGIDIHVIPDRNDQIMKDYKVKFRVTDEYQKNIRENLSTDIASNNNQKEAALPVPATYIINKERKIIAKQFDVNYRNRASVKWMLENLKKLN